MSISRAELLARRPYSEDGVALVWGCVDRGKESKPKAASKAAPAPKKKAPSAIAKPRVRKEEFRSSGSAVSFAASDFDAADTSTPRSLQDSDSDSAGSALGAGAESLSRRDDQADDEPDEVIVGPTYNAVMPKGFEGLHLGPSRPIRSRSRILCFSDIILLSQDPGQLAPGGAGGGCSSGKEPPAAGVTAAPGSPPGGSATAPVSRRLLSFGSVLHLCGHLDHCRPCMFERKSRRCKKSWLCDFCHFHGDRSSKNPSFKSNDSVAWSNASMDGTGQEEQRRTDSSVSP